MLGQARLPPGLRAPGRRTPRGAERGPPPLPAALRAARAPGVRAAVACGGGGDASGGGWLGRGSLYFAGRVQEMVQEGRWCGVGGPSQKSEAEWTSRVDQYLGARLQCARRGWEGCQQGDGEVWGSHKSPLVRKGMDLGALPWDAFRALICHRGGEEGVISRDAAYGISRQEPRRVRAELPGQHHHREPCGPPSLLRRYVLEPHRSGAPFSFSTARARSGTPESLRFADGN